MKRVFAWFLVIAVLFSNVCFAAPKISRTESVFINLDYYGDVEQINVYNSCGTVDNSELVDFGEYDSVTNLTNKNEAKVGENGERVWDVSDVNSFSYMGKMNNSSYSRVPWSFDVSYKLNGVLTSPKDLLHKSGTVEMAVDIKANDEADEYYKNNYILEITGSFDMSDYLSVESDEALFVSTGNTKTMMFIVLPGQSTDFKLRIGSDDFEMSGLTFAMVPLEGDLLDKISDIVEDKDDVEDALDEINKSTDIVLYAMRDMSAGMEEMKEGVEVLKGSTDKLHELSPKREESIKKLITSTEELRESIKDSKKDLENLNDMFDDAFDMFNDINPHIKAMSKSIAQIESDLDDVYDIVEDLPDTLDDIKDIMDTVSDLTVNVARLVEAQDSAGNIDTSELKSSLNDIGTATYSIKAQLDDVSSINDPIALGKLSSIGNNVKVIGTELQDVQKILTEIESTLGEATTSQNNLSTKLKTLANQLDDINDLIDPDDGEVVADSVSDMNSLMKDLRKTLETVSEHTDKILGRQDDVNTSIDNLKNALDSTDSMLSSINSLMDVCQSVLDILSKDVYNGGNKTADGIISITDQMLNITNQADQFIYSKDKAKDLVKKQWDKIEDETNLFNINSDIKPVSFTSTKNDEPDKVQFLLKLPDIMEAGNESNNLEVDANNGTFWSRLLNIFEKMFSWILNIPSLLGFNK